MVSRAGKRPKHKNVRSKRMKKRSLMKPVITLATVLLSAALAGCSTGETKESASAQESQATDSSEREALQTTVGRTYAKDMDLDQYVTLKDYQDFRVKQDEIEVSEEEVEELLDNVYLNSFPSELGIKDRAVAMGDSIKLDYSGTKDGVAFDGGTAQDQTLTIGSGRFIDGFEDGLVGVMPGETVELNLTFPESYDSADLAGQAVVFTVTVHSIIPEEKMDEAVRGIIEEVNTVEELRQYIRDYLKTTAEMDAQEEYEEKIMDAFLEEICEFKELPAEWKDYYYNQARNYFISMALQYGTDPDTLVQYYYGTDLETFVTDYADLATRRDLAMQAVARKENLLLQSDEELDELLEQYAQEAGSESVADYLGENSKEDFRQDYHYEKGFSFIIELASRE